MVKQLLVAMICLLGFSCPIFGQTYLEFELGTSKSDQLVRKVGVFQQFNDNWRLGLRVQAGDLAYRFVDARNVNQGNVFQIGLLSQVCLAENERMRLDLFINPAWRSIRLDEESPSDMTNYEFQNSQAIVVDPGLLVSIKAHEKLWFFTGFNSHMAFQVDPSFLVEQNPSGFLLFGGSLRSSKKSLLYANATYGGTSGGEGDTEKFFWGFNLGIRFSLSKDLPVNPIINF